MGLSLGTAGLAKVALGTTEVQTISVGTQTVWTGAVTLPAIGDSFMGGYFAGIIDTTKGNIIATDASQSGLRYALIVAPKSLESTKQYKTFASAAPAAAETRWDGSTATAAMTSASYPAANYCNGLTYPADSASHWYLPAMDELELLYRNLKPTTEANYTVGFTSTAGSFPYDGDAVPRGYDPSSDPPGASYTSGSPAQTAVALFKTGGAQCLDTTGKFYWSATQWDGTYAWVQATSGSTSGGRQAAQAKTTINPVRPVRRLIL